MSHKKKILFLVTQSEIGGAQRYIIDITTALKDKFDIIVGAGGKDKLFDELDKRQIKTIKLNFPRSIGNFLSWPFEIFQLYKIIKQQKPDIVHLNSSKMGVIGAIAAKLAGVEKVIYTVHGFVFNEPMTSFSKKFYIMAERFSANFKDLLICVSDFDRNQGLQYKIASEKKITSIHNGIETSLTFLSNIDAKKELNISSKLVVGTIANFYPTKDLITFINVASLVIKKFPNINFVIIGDGRQKKEIEDEIDSLKLNDKILLIGQKNNAYKYLNAFDVYLCTSVKEGFPISILEAMLAKIPVVATNVGGIPEMIKDKYNGILIEPKDIESMAKKIINLIVDKKEAEKIAKVGYNRVVEKFSLDRTIKETSKHYD